MGTVLLWRGCISPLVETGNSRHSCKSAWWDVVHTNTYAQAKALNELYRSALKVPGIRGLCIGTRPDCLADDVIQFLEELAQEVPVFLELGVQSFEDPTLLWLKRGHSGACSLEVLERLRQKAPHVELSVHLIFGSPTDSLENAKNSALLLNSTGVQGVKLHQLMVLKHTELERRWQEKPFYSPSLEQYAAELNTFLSFLSPKIYIERLYASASHPAECISPSWSCERWKTHNFMQNYFIEKRVFQGSLLAAS